MWKILAELRVVNIFDETICFSKSLRGISREHRMSFSERLYGLSLGNKSSDCYLINGLKDHFETTLNSLTSTPTNYRYHSLCDLFLTHSTSLKNIMPVKFL